MKKVVHKSDERGRGEHGWLKTRYSFSFADWFNPDRMGFGLLRVLNDDIIAPMSGFGEHSHRDMEIVTIVTSGAVTHHDSVGGVGEVGVGEVQVMSAGSGVVHSEYNSSKTESLSLFQIWIETRVRGSVPRYDQRSFQGQLEQSGVVFVVSPDAKPIEGSLTIAQDAYVALAKLDKHIEYEMRSDKNGLYIFVVEGEIEVDGEVLGSRDAVGISEVLKVSIVPRVYSRLLLIEVPMSV